MSHAVLPSPMALCHMPYDPVSHAVPPQPCNPISHAVLPSPRAQCHMQHPRVHATCGLTPPPQPLRGPHLSQVHFCTPHDRYVRCRTTPCQSTCHVRVRQPPTLSTGGYLSRLCSFSTAGIRHVSSLVLLLDSFIHDIYDTVERQVGF